MSPVLKVKQLDGSWLPVGGAAVGVPVGGAQNAILSKSSATDYAVQWTTAPILTGLTSSGPITLANSIGFNINTAAGTPRRALIVGGDDNLYIGIDQPAGKPIVGGSGGAKLLVQNDLEVGGTLISKNAVRAAGYVNANGTFSASFGYASVAKQATGVYRLTYSATYPYHITIAMPAPGAGVACLGTGLSSTQYDIYIFNTQTGAATDYAFQVMTVAW